MKLHARSAFVLALGFSALTVTSPSAAASASLVADVNSSSDSGNPNDFGPHQLAVAGGKVVFAAFEPSVGVELWASDPSGTTELLRDTCPGSCPNSFEVLATVGGVVYFLAGEPFDTRTLWRTDGTRAGTFPLVGFAGSSQDSLPHAVVGGTFYFTFCGEACALWKSNGSAAGTVQVRELGNDFGLLPRELTALGSRLFFFHDEEQGGRGLWRSDGTAAGTVLVRELPGDQRLLTAAGARLFFLAGQDGEELWTSDGTAVGTRPLTDFAAPEPFEGVTHALEPLGNAVYFLADDVTGGVDLWTSDGSFTGTHRVTDFGFARPFPAGLELEQVGGRLLFLATDGISGLKLWASAGTPETTAELAGSPRVFEGTRLIRVGPRVLFNSLNPSFGQDLWASDGTAGGTRRLRTVCTGSCSDFTGFVPLPGQTYFTVGGAVWRSNGTPTGTRRLISFARDAGLFRPLEAVALGGRVLFGADDGGPYGSQLWSSNGTAAGTTLVTAVGTSGAGSSPHLEIGFGGHLLFTACDGEDRILYRTGGQGAAAFGPPAVRCFESAPRALREAGGQVFYIQEDLGVRQLFRTDGTAAGTRRLTAFTTSQSVGFQLPVVFGGKIVFPVVRSGESGVAFWTSDGTAAGTGPFLELPGLFYEGFLTALGPELYFVATGEEGTEIWRSDGTFAGSRRVALLNSGFFSGASPEFTRAGGAVYFQGQGNSGFDVLWRSDGTAAGTAPVPRTGELGVSPRHLFEFGGALYFFGFSPGAAARGLIRTDGTAAGTVLLRAVAPPEPTFGPESVFFTALGPRLYFAAADAAHGAGLWATDGTAAGTVLVEDIAPGPASADPRGLRAASGRLFFSARDGSHGTELWESDGTAAGTRLVQDLAPGPLSSHPEQLTAVGDRLFFAADDGVWGQEVWSLPLAAGLPACQPSAATLCLNGGRFRAEAVWRDFAGRTGTGTAVALSADTGYFWFFDAANVEVVLKVLDGRGNNGHFWAFYGALSNVEYTLTITDTQTGAARRYVNPLGRFASVGDTVAFGPRGAQAAGLSLAPPPPAAAPLLTGKTAPATAAIPATRADKAPCTPAPTRLCLNGGRFALEAAWRDFTGRTGVGTAVALTGDTGYFWFFDAANVEAVVKVLDGRPLNGKFWVFYGALSNVEYTLTVTDTETGAKKTYTNPLGRFASGADTGAF